MCAWGVIMEVKTYYNLPELMATEPRKRRSITMSGSLSTYLDYLFETLHIENYSKSYLIEDIIYFVVSNEERLKKFIDSSFELDVPIKIIPPSQEMKEAVQEIWRNRQGGVDEKVKNKSESK